MAKSKEDVFLESLPDSENDFLSGIPNSTPTGLPELSASATPTIDAAQTPVQVDPALTNASPAPMPTPTPSPAQPPVEGASWDKTQAALDVADAALKAGGMIGGGIAGAPFAPATFGASVPAGAALGYGLGASASNLLQRALGKKKPLNNLPEAVLETGQQLKEGAEQEAVGAAMSVPMAVAGKVLAPLAEKAGSVGAKSVDYLLAKAEQYGMKLTPAEVTQSKGLQLLENFLSNLPFSAGRINKFRGDQLEALVKQRENLLSNNGGEKALEEVGTRIKNAVDDAVKDYSNFSETNLARLKDRVLQKVGSPETYHDLIQPLQMANEKNILRLRETKNTFYENAKDLMPDDLTVVPENLIGEASRFKDELLKLPAALQDKQALAVVDELTKSPNPVNADTIVATRKALNSLVAKETNFVTGEMTNTGRVYRQMIDGLDKDMTAMAESTGNETIIQAQQIANKANADYKNYLKDPLVKKIAEGKKPDAIVGAVYSPGNDTEIKKFQDFYGPQFAGRAKKVFTNSFLGLNPDPSIPNAPLTGNFIRTQMQRYGTTLNTIYTPAEIGYMRRAADVLDGNISLGNEVVKNPIMKSIVKSPMASGIIDIIVKPRDVGNIALVKQYVGDEGMKEVQNGLVNKLFLKNKYGNFAPQTFANEFNKYDARVLKSVFPEEVYNDMKHLAEVSTRVGGAEKLAGNPSGTAKNVMMMFGTGFMVHNPITTTNILLGSRAFTELYLSKMGRQWLTKGFTLPAISSQAAQVASKITLLMLEHEKEKMKNQGEK